MIADLSQDASAGSAEALRDLGRRLDSSEPIIGLDTLAPHEAARLVLALRPRRARALLKRLPDAPSLALLEALDPSIAERLLDDEQVARIAKIAAKLDIEEAAKFLAEAPRSLMNAVVSQSADPDALRAAIDFRAETAGAIMRRRLVAAPSEWTVEQVVEDIRAHADVIDKLYAVYVVDAERRLRPLIRGSSFSG